MNGNGSAMDENSVTDKINKFGGKETVARIGQDMLIEAIATAASQNFDLMRILTDNFYYCKNKLQNTNDPVFAFNFLRCGIEGIKELKEIWKKYDDGIVLKDYTFPSMYPTTICQKYVDGGKCTEMVKHSTGFITSTHRVEKKTIRMQIAFSICAPYGGTLPTASTREEFLDIYKLFQGDKNKILFGEVYRGGDNGSDLFWCDGGAKVPVAVRLMGTNELLNSIPGETSSPASSDAMNRPFVVFTDSTMGDNPYLMARTLNINADLNSVYCMHTALVKQQCDSGLRTQEVPSPLEQLIAENNINIFDDLVDANMNELLAYERMIARAG